MTENLMSIKEVAEYLHMNKMTIYKLAREGKIPAFKVASEWRFKKELLDQFLMGQLKVKPNIETLNIQGHLAEGKTVLIVDDEQVIRDYFARVLTEFNVLNACSGEEALDIIRKQKPDLVLLDIKMPGIDGIETLRQIKKMDKNIEVIMLSAYGTIKTSMEAARLGAYDSMAKPFDLSEMKSVIQKALTAGEEANKE